LESEISVHLNFGQIFRNPQSSVT